MGGAQFLQVRLDVHQVVETVDQGAHAGLAAK